MAKAKQWEDVKLLSFDLQTVEFTYASVRTHLFDFTTRCLITKIGLHALYILQGPAPHGRIIQPPLQTSPIPTRSPRPPPKSARRRRGVLPRAPPTGPTRRRPPSTRLRPTRHCANSGGPGAHPFTRGAQDRLLVASHVWPS
jgi:hypothetical protein